MDNYIVSARKYRPSTFQTVVGQKALTTTLKNAIAGNKLAHAYLFSGPRGVGKTTCARIFAKTINCLSPTSEHEACNACESCVAFNEQRSYNIHELDAASNNGVDDIRSLIDQVRIPPQIGKYKVYIIDEVHMLSTSAFNALLKSLEEPPSRTVFILCTTHPHKVPETIHSRCQRFDFRRLSVDDIVGRLRVIGDAESVDVPDGALTLIAKHALGGMRDAITTLEQLASFGGGTIGLEDVEGLLGEMDTDALLEAASLILERDIAGAFRFIASLADTGVDMSEFVKGLVKHFRDLFVLAAVGADVAVDATSRDLGRLQSQASRFGADRVGRILEILQRLTTELRYAADQRLAVEVAMTRMARPHGDLTLESLAERIDALESGAPLVEFATSMAPAPAPEAAIPAAPSGQSAKREQPAAPVQAQEPVAPPVQASDHRASAGDLDVAAVKRAWPAVLAEIKKIRAPRAHIFNGTEAEIVSGTLVVEFPADQRFALDLARESETLSVLRRAVRAVLGQEPPVEYSLGRQGRSEGAPVPCDEPTPATTPATAELEAAVLAELGGELIDDVTLESEDV